MARKHTSVETKEFVSVLPAPEHVGEIERRLRDRRVRMIERLRHAERKPQPDVFSVRRAADDLFTILRRAVRARRASLEAQERDVSLLPRAVLFECERRLMSRAIDETNV